MKKFLIGVIFLIPIVVVISLSATGTIIGLTTTPNPSEIIIKNSDNEVITKDSEPIRVDYRDDSDFLIIDVLPTIVKDENKAIEWEVVAEESDGDASLELMGELGKSNRYRIIPKKIGAVKFIINPQANANIYQEVTIYVTSDSIESIKIYNEEGNDVGQFYDVSKNERFFVDIYPIDALYGNEITWTCIPTEVAEITQNGLLMVKDHGDCRVRATATDKDGNTVYAEVDVNTRNAIASSNVVYTTLEVVDEAWVLENVALSATDTEIENASENRFKLIRDGKEMVVEVVTVEDEIGFIDLPEVVYTRNGGYLPTIGNVVTGEVIEGAIIEVSDATTLQIEEVTGLLVPQKAGEVTVKATIGGTQIEKVITVRENPIAFELDLSVADGKLGIQQTRTWGQYWFDDNYNLIQDYTFGLYDDSNRFDVEWALDNPDYATLTLGEGQNVVIRFADAVRGQSVTLTAYLKINNRRVERVKRSFTFNVREKNAVNVESWEEFKKTFDLRRYDIVLQNNVICDSTSGVSSSVYGNGFTIDCSTFPLDTSRFRTSAIDPSRGGNAHYEWQETGTGTMVFENIVAIGATAWHDQKGHVFGLVKLNWMEAPVAFRFCEISGFNEGMDFNNCIDATVEGCIIGDNLNSAVILQYEPGRAETCVINLKNNVFKNSEGASVQLVTSVFDGRIAGKTMDVEINVEGIMDVYNWKERSEFGGVFASTVLGLVGNNIAAGALRELMADAVAGVIESFIFNEGYNHLFYKYAGKEYASLGIFGVGLIAKADVNKVTMNTESDFAKFAIPLVDENGNPAGSLGSVESLIEMIIHQSGFSITNECFLVCPDFVTAEPKIKPGDPVPNSKELYAQLQGVIA